MPIGAIDRLSTFLQRRLTASDAGMRRVDAMDEGALQAVADSLTLSKAAQTSGRAWHALWLPTMDVRSLPVLDPLSPWARRDARHYVRDQSVAFEQALAKAEPETQQKLGRVRRVVAGDPLAEAALVRFQLGGKLSGSTGSTLLDALDGMARSPLAGPVDRRALLTHTLQELDDPARITQGIKMTCEATSLQILLARRDPAEYVRLVSGLASPEGTVTLRGGGTIARVSDWQSATDAYRSEPSRLIQPAFATYADAPHRYSNTRDADELGRSGLDDSQLTKLSTAVFGQPFTFLSPANSTSVERMAAYRHAVNEGWSVPAWLDWATGHVVLAEPEQAGRVVIDNPFGAVQSLRPDAFQAALHSVYVPVTRG